METTESNVESFPMVCGNVWFSDGISIVTPLIYIIIFIVGVWGNGLVVVSLLVPDQSGKTLCQRSVTNLFVLNLALADIVFVGTLPFWIFEVASYGRWILGLVGCKLLSFITLLNLYGSVFFLMWMSCDRFIAVVYPIRWQKFRTQRIARVTCLVIWFMACLVASQSLVLREMTTMSEQCPDFYRCYWYFYKNNKLESAYFVVRTGFGFFIPFVVISLCYLFIFLSLKKRNQKKSSFGKKIPEQRVAQMISWVIGAFILCWLPNHVMTLVYVIGQSFDISVLKKINYRVRMFFK